VHLKSLTLRGFKSFASTTTLRFEPGITCVVGPNGSGKSNVVDAIAWVMGEQGAKSLRGGKMEDVIFAGAAGRAPLGRAEVVLTIDNTDGALPIDYAEVTISRIMFRNGGSEYAINGDPCRLLDVQELLSDSGIGRELHVVVGQGQLDAVLAARPDERRAFIEEAAGVLKHRKRKEKALRKLEAMQANLTRIQDLTGELRRQLKPLGKQAEVARRAATVQADLRDARLRLAADDLVAMRATLEQEVADETAVRERRSIVERDLAELTAREEALEREVAADAPRLARAQELWYRLSSLRERFRGTASLAAERQRSLAAAQAEDEARVGAADGRDPEALEAEAAAAREEHAGLATELETGRAALAHAEALRAAREAELVEEEQRVAAAARAAADRREGLARLTGQVAAARSRVTAGEEEIERLARSLEAARERATAAHRDYVALETQVADLDQGEMGLDEQYEQATKALAAAEADLNALQAEEREAERDRSALAARVEALQLGLTRKDGSGALLAAGDRLPGLLGPVAELVDVRDGWEVAIAVALGGAADAIAVTSLESATSALRLLKDDDAGRAGVLVGGAHYDAPAWPALPSGASYAIDLVTSPDELRPALTALLERVAVVADIEAGRDLVQALPSVRAVTRDGDLLGTGWVVGGSAKPPSLLEVQAAVVDATERLREATHGCERLRFELGAAQERRAAAVTEVESTLSRLHESDARMAAVAEQLAHLGSAARATAGEAERLGQAREQAVTAREQDRVALSALEERLAAAEVAPDDDEPTG
jgi:chromosome segregation protein